HEVARVGGAHGGGEADRVPHFTDHDDVGVLPQNVFESVFEGERVQPDLPLLDDRLVVFTHELDRVLQRNNVPFEIAINMLDQRCQSCGLATTGRAGQQHDAAR